jgi:hypothetical protein
MKVRKWIFVTQLPNGVWKTVCGWGFPELNQMICTARDLRDLVETILEEM